MSIHDDIVQQADTRAWRKKPVVIEAMRYTGEQENIYLLLKWAHGGLPPEANTILTPQYSGMLVRTLEGYLHASVGDWIIRGVKGEFYPCKPDIFAATYEPAGAATDVAQRLSAARSIVSALADYTSKELVCGSYITQELDRVMRALEGE